MIWKWDSIKKLHYEDMFRLLDKEGVRYLLIGGLAAIIYGVPRSTGDVDLMLLMTKGNINKFISIMKKLGYQPKVPVKPIELADKKKRKYWQEKKNMKAFSFQHPDDPFMVIDIMISELIDFKKAYAKREVLEQWGAKLSLVSEADLVKLKKIAGRPQDLSDIQTLKRLKELNNAAEK